MWLYFTLISINVVPERQMWGNSGGTVESDSYSLPMDWYETMLLDHVHWYRS